MYARLARALLLASTAVGAATLEGCVIDVWDLHDGWADIQWTVGGSTDANACNARGASLVAVSIWSDGGDWVANDTFDCAAFGASYRIHRGSYDVRVTLLDGRRFAVSETREVFFTVSRDRTTFVTVDFPR